MSYMIGERCLGLSDNMDISNNQKNYILDRE